MQRLAVLIAALLILAGATFVGQGLGIIRSTSPMTDDMRWAWIGGGLVIIGLIVAWWSRRGARTGMSA